MKNIIDSVFKHESFDRKPPIFIDIGASGEIFPSWKEIIQYSHCIAFEADEREAAYMNNSKDKWRKYTSFKALATTQLTGKIDFYLTESPFCSSTLKPDFKSLIDWDFSYLFDIQKVSSMDSKNIAQALQDMKISYIDWFKTDSQGTDLRLFASLPDELRHRILAADLEPGIIDAYVGEDKLHHVLAYMEQEPFWVSSMNIKGAKRILKTDLSSAENPAEIMTRQKTSPGWCEISYLNDMKSTTFDVRSHLLVWVFASILEQHGFALHIARKARKIFKEKIFAQLVDFNMSVIS